MREAWPAPDFIGTWCLSSINERGEDQPVALRAIDRRVDARSEEYAMDVIVRRVRLDDEKPCVDIGIREGRIAAIEEYLDRKGCDEIDAEGRVALPGFIELHLHLDKAFLYNRLPVRSGTL